MARIGTPRKPGQASTPRQQARIAAILEAADRLGAVHGLERVQMSDIAAEAGVALGTLYRYYPTKHHLYAASLNASIQSMPESGGIPDDPVAAICDFLGDAAERLLAQPPFSQGNAGFHQCHSVLRRCACRSVHAGTDPGRGRDCRTHCRGSSTDQNGRAVHVRHPDLGHCRATRHGQRGRRRAVCLPTAAGTVGPPATVLVRSREHGA